MKANEMANIIAELIFEEKRSRDRSNRKGRL